MNDAIKGQVEDVVEVKNSTNASTHQVEKQVEKQVEALQDQVKTLKDQVRKQAAAEEEVKKSSRVQKK
mgnify:CR=1 FL=1